jgi:hypothetical protein
LCLLKWVSGEAGEKKGAGRMREKRRGRARGAEIWEGDKTGRDLLQQLSKIESLLHARIDVDSRTARSPIMIRY